MEVLWEGRGVDGGGCGSGISLLADVDLQVRSIIVCIIVGVVVLVVVR